MQLVDTNIVSELLRPHPHPAVLTWADSLREWAVAAISVDESVFGLVRNGNRALLDAYEHLLRERCSILPITEDIARRAGRLRAGFSLRGGRYLR
jgi:predicted nucleic acid-binding protein